MAEQKPPTNDRGLAKYFDFAEHGTTYRRELVAGLTTFLAMAYILFVNPFMLSGEMIGLGGSGLFPDFGSVFTATAIAAIVGTLIMGLYAKYPIGLAPGMGLNAFFTFTVVLGMGVPWQTALTAVFLSGVIFLILTQVGMRERIIDAIPSGLKHAVGAGIGLFIAFIGLQSAGIVVGDGATLVALGPLTIAEGMDENAIFGVKETWLAVFGLIITIIMMTLKWRGAIFYGIIVTAVVGMIFNLVSVPSGFAEAPPAPQAFGSFLEPILNNPAELITWTFFIVLFTFLFVDFFDTAGTLVGVANQAGLMKENKLPRAKKALTADSTATIVGAAFGTSTTTSYIESSTGVAAGGRTGMTAVFIALFFLVALFFYPIISIITAPVTAPALILVGVLMATSLGKIAWEKIEESIPAFLTVIAMPLTYSIATGIAIGFLLYPITMLAKGEGRKVHPIMYGLFFVFIFYFIFLAE